VYSGMQITNMMSEFVGMTFLIKMSMGPKLGLLGLWGPVTNKGITVNKQNPVNSHNTVPFTV
jgi:hypothetical protein